MSAASVVDPFKARGPHAGEGCCISTVRCVRREATADSMASSMLETEREVIEMRESIYLASARPVRALALKHAQRLQEPAHSACI